MNRTDRLFTILLELRSISQDGGWIRAEDLARTFHISVRTVYRDVAALNESGVPVVSCAGKGYQLLDGYFLPPLHFTPLEAFVLLLGADALSSSFDAECADATREAIRKLRAALPEEKRREVDHLQDAVNIVPSASAQDDGLRSLRTAVLGRNVVAFEYHKPHSRPERREVHPRRLAQVHGVWLLGAFDPLREDWRIFRISRMDDLRVLDATFTPHEEHEGGGPRVRDRRNIAVHLRFAPGAARALLERPSPFQVDRRPHSDWLEVILKVRDVRDALPWVLSWGGDVRVLAPGSLRELVHEEARKILLT